MILAAMNIMKVLNITLLAIGGVVLVVCLTVVTARRHWRATLSCVPVRTRRLDLVHVALVLMVLLTGMALLNTMGAWLPIPKGMTVEQWRGTGETPGLWAVVAQTAAKVLAAVVLVGVIAITLEGGLPAFGLHRLGPGDLLWGAGGYLAVWPLCLGLANAVVWITGQPPQHAVIHLLRAEGVPLWGTVTLWVGALLISPVTEELFFRGLLQTVFRGYFSNAYLAIGLSAVCFGMVHWSQPQYVAALTVLGLALGYVYEHTGSLVAPIILHVLFNSRTMLMDFLSQRMSAG